MSIPWLEDSLIGLMRWLNSKFKSSGNGTRSSGIVIPCVLDSCKLPHSTEGAGPSQSIPNDIRSSWSTQKKIRFFCLRKKLKRGQLFKLFKRKYAIVITHKFKQQGQVGSSECTFLNFSHTSKFMENYIENAVYIKNFFIIYDTAMLL